MGGALRYITNKPDLTEVHAGFNASYAMTRYGDATRVRKKLEREAATSPD